MKPNSQDTLNTKDNKGADLVYKGTHLGYALVEIVKTRVMIWVNPNDLRSAE